MTTQLRVTQKDSLQQMIDKLTARISIMALGITVLILMGISLVIGPKFPAGPIHISLVGGHGITTQDLVALIPLSVALAWFGLGLWKYQERWVGAMRRHPVKTFVFALALGLFIGFIVGLPVGAVFDREVERIINLITT